MEYRVGQIQNPYPSILTTEYMRLENLSLEIIIEHQITSPFIFIDGSKIYGKVGVAIK